MGELRVVQTAEEWAAYHSIRERVLWEARSKNSKYDPNHPDDRSSGNHPLIYNVDGKPVGVLRVDVDGDVAWFRRVAIAEGLQRQGHGTRMMADAMDFARKHGCTIARSNVARDAIGFYEKLDFQIVDEVHPDGGVPMMRNL